MLNYCPVCASGISEIGDKLWSCLACDHIFENPPLVTAVYDSTYVADRYDKYDTTELMSHLRLGLVAIVGNGGSKLLDVGYGNGSFIKLAVKAGYDAWGSDIHECGNKYGVRDVSLDAKLRWDIVTFFDSMEHFPNLEPIKALLTRCASAVVSVPCRPRSFPKDRQWKHYRPGEHLHYFSPTSLRRMFGDFAALPIHDDIEDVIRGPINGNQNIMTMVFKRDVL